MTNISQDQLDRFWIADKDDFIRQLYENIVEEVPWVSRAWPPEFIRTTVAYAVDRALANGFEKDTDIRTFVDIMFAVTPDFDQHPEIHKVLSDTSLSTEERWDKLSEDPAYAKIWEELTDISHENEWFAEGHGDIRKAYPTTYMLPGFIALYQKRREEEYYFLSPGESVSGSR